MAELVSVLLSWICLQLGVEAPAPPAVEFASQQQLVAIAYQGHAPPDASVTAAYSRARGTVYLSTAWRRDDLRDRSTLVHELVHHVQERRRLPYPCLAARERDAYALQAQWLRQNGIPAPYAFLDIDAFTIAVLSMCTDE